MPRPNRAEVSHTARRRYDPDLDHRRSVRLPGHDYARGAEVFVTVCSHQRLPLFGEVTQAAVRLSDIGRIIEQCWLAIPNHFPGVRLEGFVVMPNHLHGVLVIKGLPPAARIAGTRAQGEACLAPTEPRVNAWQDAVMTPPSTGSLGAIIGSFKSAATRQAHELRESPGAPLWQRNYYEHVIATANELARVRDYVAANPANWTTDEFYPRLVSRIP